MKKDMRELPRMMGADDWMTFGMIKNKPFCKKKGVILGQDSGANFKKMSD